MTAAIFLLRANGDEAIVGAALVCFDARYCSVRLRGAERLDRRVVAAQDWRAIATDLGKMPTGPTVPGAAIVRVLAPEGQFRVEFLTIDSDFEILDVEATLDGVALTLDGILRAQPLDELNVRETQEWHAIAHHAVLEAHRKARERGLTDSEVERERDDPDSEFSRDASEAFDRLRKPRLN